MERLIDSGSSAAKSFLVVVSFHGDLGFFDKARDRLQPVRRVLTHKTTVKDVIESLGVPPPEVDLIVFNGQPIDFSFRLQADAALDVYPIASDLFPSCRRARFALLSQTVISESSREISACSGWTSVISATQTIASSWPLR
jgi:hypothetical protein